jgi:CBS domain-containing protein
METERIRHLLVLDDEGKLAGVVSQRDVFFNALLRALGFGQRAKEHALESLRVKDVMVDQVVTITPDATVGRAASLMSQLKIGCLPVLDGDRLVGILTESDLVRTLAEVED